MMDMVRNMGSDRSAVRYQYCKDGKYIHLKRNNGKRVVYAFFHIELEDKWGGLMCLPGQMVVCADYTWTDGVEPVLLELLEGIKSCD